MGKIKYYVAAMRLRTIPLSLAGVSLGIMLAAADYRISWQVVGFILLTTVSLQLLSNVSNELGDYLRGTDSADRKGPCYSLTTGKLGERDFKGMIVAYILLSAVSGLAMIWFRERKYDKNVDIMQQPYNESGRRILPSKLSVSCAYVF